MRRYLTAQVLRPRHVWQDTLTELSGRCNKPLQIEQIIWLRPSYEWRVNVLSVFAKCLVAFDSVESVSSRLNIRHAFTFDCQKRAQGIDSLFLQFTHEHNCTSNLLLKRISNLGLCLTVLSSRRWIDGKESAPFGGAPSPSWGRWPSALQGASNKMRSKAAAGNGGSSVKTSGTVSRTQSQTYAQQIPLVVPILVIQNFDQRWVCRPYIISKKKVIQIGAQQAYRKPILRTRIMEGAATNSIQGMFKKILKEILKLASAYNYINMYPLLIRPSLVRYPLRPAFWSMYEKLWLKYVAINLMHRGAG